MPETRALKTAPGPDELLQALSAQNEQLQRMVVELLIKNEELRRQVATHTA
jgi:hypothetical protein